MPRASIREYTEAVRWRYLQAPKKEKVKILDEFAILTDYHRKSIICLLRRVNRPNSNRKRVRARQYSAAVIGSLRIPGKPLTVCVPIGYIHFSKCHKPV